MGEKVKFDAELDARKFLAGVEKINRSMERLEKTSAKALKTSDVAFGSFLGTVGGNVAIAAFSRFKQLMGEVADEALQFEKAINEINTILPKNTKLTKNQTAALMELSSQYGTTPQKQAKAFYQIISAGITDVTKAQKLLDAANKLALGGLGDLQSSINVLTDIVNVYGVDSADAVDSLFQTVKLGKTTVESLSTALGTVIPTANKLNVSLDEVNAALATMTTQGLTTQERVTQLDALFISLFKSGDDIRKMYGTEVAKAFSATALRTKGLRKFLDDLMVATGGNEEVLRKLVGRKEGFRAILALTGKQVQKYNDTLVQYKDKTGAAQDATDIMRDSLDIKWDLFSQKIKNMASSLLQDLTPAAKEVLGVLNDLTDAARGGANQQEILENRLALLKKQLEDLPKGQFFRDGFDREGKIKAEIEAVSGALLALEIASGGVTAITDESFLIKEELKAIQKELRAVDEGLSFKNMAEVANMRARVEELKQKLIEVKEVQNEPVNNENITKKVQLEKDAIAEIAALEAEAAVTKEENRLIGREKEEEFRELTKEQQGEEFQRLQDLEAQKFKLKFDAEEAKIKLISDNSKREAGLQKLAAKKEIETEKRKNIALKAQRAQDIKNTAAQQNAKLGLARASASAIVNLTGQGAAVAFAISKSFAVADIMLKASQAKVALAAQLPPPPAPTGVLYTAGVGNIEALRAISLATVAAQSVAELAAPKFAEGGIVPGSSFTGDNVKAFVNSGELILNRAQQDVIAGDLGGNDELLSSINDRLGMLIEKDTSINIEGREIARTVRREKEDGFNV
jgi:TP901 family phage tail tape measure protein